MLKKLLIESTVHSELGSFSPGKSSFGVKPAISTFVACVGKESRLPEIGFKLSVVVNEKRLDKYYQINPIKKRTV